MRYIIYLCLCVSSFSLWSDTTYKFCPRGKFYYKCAGAFVPDYVKFHSYDIYEKGKDTSSIQNSVKDLNEWVRAYTYYDSWKKASTMHSSFFSMGSLLDSMKQFQVYDYKGDALGTIEGTFYTTNAAEFIFYDNNTAPFATAVLDRAYKHMIIKNNDDVVVFSCTKVLDMDSWFILDCKRPLYYWIIDKTDDDMIDERFFWPFMSFISEVWWY